MMRLTVTAGPDRGRAFRLPEGQTIVIGRGKNAAIRLNDPSVSRLHCQIRTDRQGAMLADCNSTAGTYLNDERIDEQSLDSGDVIRAGATQMRFEAGTAADRADGAGAPAVEAKALPKNELDDLVGKTIYCYHMIEVLAHGKSGTVFHALNVESGQYVAVRVLWPKIARDADGMKRFVVTMKAMFPVWHPNVVRVYHANRSGPYWWIAMELVEGESLREAIGRIGSAADVDWRDAFRVAVHMAKALEVADRHQIVDRNLTPQNVLVSREGGMAKVNDLMLATALDAASAKRMVRPGKADVAYLAPERTRTAHALDGRADLYSLGAIAYARLCGRPPFDAPTLKELVAKIRDEPVVRPSALGASVPEPFETILLRTLEKAPEDRYGTPSDLVEALEQVGSDCGLVL